MKSHRSHKTNSLRSSVDTTNQALKLPDLSFAQTLRSSVASPRFTPTVQGKMNKQLRSIRDIIKNPAGNPKQTISGQFDMHSQTQSQNFYSHRQQAKRTHPQSKCSSKKLDSIQSHHMNLSQENKSMEGKYSNDDKSPSHQI